MAFRVKVTDRNGYPRKQCRVNIIWKDGGQSQSYTDDSGTARFEGNGGVAESIKVLDKAVEAGVRIGHDSIIPVEYNG